MASWGELPLDLADAGYALLYQVGVGLGFLGTVRRDGGPRMHPMCPLITDDALFALLVPSPKRDDLARDGRFALHSFPCDENEDAFYATGRALEVDDADVRARAVQQFADERKQFGVTPDALADQGLFELDVEMCMVTRTTGHGDPNPQHEVWHAR